MQESQSPVSRERFPFLIGATALAVAISFLQVPWLTAAGAIMVFFVFWFFRDPERSGPSDERMILSPADGRVVAIEAINEDRFLKQHALRISIFLSIFDVHVNRIPCSGRIKDVIYQPGRFFMAQREEASRKNEQNAILLERGSGERLVFVQIAGFIARRILCWVYQGDQVRQGSRFGMIRFGSRMDLYLPMAAQVKVRVGEQVRGGQTVIGEMP